MAKAKRKNGEVSPLLCYGRQQDSANKGSDHNNMVRLWLGVTSGTNDNHNNNYSTSSSSLPSGYR